MSRVVFVGQRTLLPGLVAELKSTFGAVRFPSDPDERAAFLASSADDVRVLVTPAVVGAQAELMDYFPNLSLVANYGVGYDGVDLDAARQRGIVVANTPDVLNDCVADLAVGLLIDVMRGLSESDRFSREGRWGSEVFPLRRRVTGTRVGIVGLGRIGREIATRLAGFRCDIHYHNRSERHDVEYGYVASIHELASWSDALIIATPGGDDTRALVDAEVLSALGPDGFLINIARGSVVDETALVQALTSGTIAGAGLDVYADEPRIPEELRALKNVVLAPHIASGTIETRQAMADVVLDNVRTWLDEGRAVTPVN